MPENKVGDNPPVEVFKRWYQKSIKELWEDFKYFLDDLVDLRDGMDQEGTIQNILNNKRMRGANAWLLMCSIMVASLGLDLNSPAVIIGAMLISPLMSPILGVGLGVGINDKETLFVSLQHFFVAFAIALVTSFLYFKITPFGELTDEIKARTAPNLLDGLIAIFGGTAGIISTTRLDKSNAIPGVAIATALMPPLCVAGYGLAKGETQFFLNAFYLFFLNSFFIAISTYLVIRLLRFRYKQYPNRQERRRNTVAILIFSIIMLVPAILLLRKAIKDVQEKQIIEGYIMKTFRNSETTITDWNIISNDTLVKLEIQLIGNTVSKEKIIACDLELEQLINKRVAIFPYQSRGSFDEVQKLRSQLGEIQGEELVNRLDSLEYLARQSGVTLQRTVDSLQNHVNLEEIFQKAKINYENLEEIGFSPHFHNVELQETDSVQIVADVPMLYVRWNARKSEKEQLQDEAKLLETVKIDAKLDTLVVIGY